MSQVQVFVLVCDTPAKQHWKRSTGTIIKKNKSNLQCKLRKTDQNFYKWEGKKLKTGKQDQIGKMVQHVKAPARKTDHQSLTPSDPQDLHGGRKELTPKRSTLPPPAIQSKIYTHMHIKKICLVFYNLARMEWVDNFEHQTYYCSGTIFISKWITCKKDTNHMLAQH